MGSHVIVVQSDPPPKTRRGLPPNGWGEWLLFWANRDEIAESLGVTPLSQFFRTLSLQERDELAEVVARLRGTPVEYPAREEWHVPWSDPTDGLATVRALIGFAREHPEAIRLSDRTASAKQIPKGILGDLGCLEAHLVAAAKRKARFHLEAT